VVEELQRSCLSMPSALSRALHAAAFCWYALVVKSLMEKDGEQLPAGIFVYGGPWKYLTFLNLVSASTHDITVVYDSLD